MQILKNESVVSTDTDLQGIISDLTTSMKARSTASTIDESINLAMIHTSVYVGEALLDNESMLLPSVHNLFYSDEPLVIARWVLSNLVATYKHHLSTVCKIKKHETILYRTGDLLTTLSKALYKSKSNSKVQSESVPCASQSMDGIQWKK